MKHGLEADDEEARWYFVSSYCRLNVALTIERGIFNTNGREKGRVVAERFTGREIFLFHDTDACILVIL